jgi:hypothetical protein
MWFEGGHHVGEHHVGWTVAVDLLDIAQGHRASGRCRRGSAAQQRAVAALVGGDLRAGGGDDAGHGAAGQHLCPHGGEVLGERDTQHVGQQLDPVHVRSVARTHPSVSNK